MCARARAGRELLSEFEADQKISIEGLRQTAAGRDRLTRLTKAVSRCFEPIVSAAAVTLKSEA